MSTHLHTKTGKYEIPDPSDKSVKHEDAQLHITRFYGGKEKGTCFQITIQNGEVSSFIQLTAQQYYELVAEMHNH